MELNFLSLELMQITISSHNLLKVGLYVFRCLKVKHIQSKGILSDQCDLEGHCNLSVHFLCGLNSTRFGRMKNF